MILALLLLFLRKLDVMKNLMKMLLLPLVVISIVVSVPSCDLLEDAGLSSEEVAAALRQALEVSTDTSVTQASQLDGYYENLAVRILLPPEVATAQDYITSNFPASATLIDPLVSALVVKLNRAAEDAATKATPIFVDAITGITIDDAFGILNGADTAATAYLKSKTYVGLKTEFQPDIETSLSAVGAQQAYSQLATAYNSAVSLNPFASPPSINTDLADFTTGKALDGLFYFVAEEEKEIRANPLDRVTDLLQKVFGSID